LTFITKKSKRNEDKTRVEVKVPTFLIKAVEHNMYDMWQLGRILDSYAVIDCIFTE
jgi:hypothetical protein